MALLWASTHPPPVDYTHWDVPGWHRGRAGYSAKRAAASRLQFAAAFTPTQTQNKSLLWQLGNNLLSSLGSALIPSGRFHLTNQNPWKCISSPQYGLTFGAFEIPSIPLSSVSLIIIITLAISTTCRWFCGVTRHARGNSLAAVWALRLLFLFPSCSCLSR